MTSSLEKRYPPIKLTNGTDAIVPSTLRDSNTNTNIKDSTSGQTMNVSVTGADYGNGDYEVKIGALNWGSNKTSAGASIANPAVGGLFKIFETQTTATTSEDTLRLGLTGNNHTTLTGANSYNYVHNTQSQGILTLHTAMSNSNFLFRNGIISSDSTSAEYYGAFNGNNAFTIDFYFSTLQSGPDRAMFSVGGSQIDKQSFTIYMHNGTIKISAGGATYSVDFSDSFSNLNDGKIYHLRCKYNGTTISSIAATNNVELKIIEAGQNIDAASYITKSFLPTGTDYLSISIAISDQLIYFGRHANKSSSIYNFIGKLHYNLSIGHNLDYAIDGGYEAATNNQAVDNYYMTNFIKDSDGNKTHIASGTNGIPGQWISLKIPAVAAVTQYADEDDPEEIIELSAVDSSPNGIIPTKFYIGGITEPFPKTITVLGSTDGTHYTTIVDNAHKQLKDGTFEMLVKTLNNTYNEFVFIFTQTTLPGNYLEITELGVYGYEPSNTTFIDSTGIGNSTLKPMYYNDFTSHVFDGNMFSYVNITPDEDISGSTPFTIDINYSTDTVNNHLGPIFSMGRDNVVAGNYTIEQNPLSSPTNDHYTWRLNNTHYISYANMLPSTATISTDNANINFVTPHDNSINLLPDINTRHQLVVSSDGSYNVNFMLDGKIVKTELRQTTAHATKPNNLNNGKDSMFNISIGNRTPKFSFNTPYNGSNEFYFDGTTSNVINLNDSGNITRNGTILFANAGFAWMAGNAARTVTFEMKTTAVNVGGVILIGTGDNNNGGRFNVVIDQYGKLWINAHNNDTSHATHDDIRDGQWHFVSISWDGTDIQIYLDKKLVLTDDLTTLITPSNGGVAYLGANVDPKLNRYTGYLRNVHFYNGNTHTDNKFKGKIHRVAVYKDLFIDDPQKIKILDISGGVNVSKVQNNSDLKIHSTGALQIPNHTIDPEIITPEQSKGSIYYNTMFNCYKGYDGTSWKVIKGGITNESGTVYVNSDANMSLFTSHIGQNAVLDISMENIEFKNDSNGNRLLIDIIGSGNLKGAKNIQGTPLSIVLKVKFDDGSRAIGVSQEIIKRFFDIENVAEDDGFFGTHSTTSHWGRGYLYSSTTDNNNTINSLGSGNNATVETNEDYIAIISYNGDKTITYTIYNETTGGSGISISETQDYYQNLTLNDGFYFGGDSNNWFDGTIYYMQIHHHYFSTYPAFTQHVDGYIVLSSINEDITMTNYGNVGIGSTNPQTTLDVNGSLGVSTDIEFYDPMFTSARGSVRYNNPDVPIVSNPAYQSISLEHENATIANGYYNNKLTISDGVTLSMNNGTSLDFNKTNTRIKNGRGNAELNIGGSVAIGSTYDGLQVKTNTLYVEGAVGIGTTSILENDNMVIYDKTLAKDAVNISKAGSIIMDNSGGFNNEKMLYFPPCKIRPSSFKTLAHANLTNANGTSQTLAPNAEQIDVYFDVSQNNLSYGRGRYYLSMASVETNNLGYKHLFSGIPSSGDTQHLVSKENTIYPNPSYIASTNAPNYQDLNIYGWWFSLQMPNPITLDHFTVNLEKGTNPVIRRIKRVFVIATNDSVDYYKLGYFGGAGVHGSSVISSDANLAQFSYYAEQGKNMQSSPFLKYIFIVTQTNGDVNNVALSSFRIYGSQGKLKIHQSLNASRAYIGNKKPYFSYGVNNPITFNNTDVDLTDNGFKCIKGKAPRTFEFEINSIFNLSKGTSSNGIDTQYSNFIATGNRLNNKQTFNIRQAKDKLAIVRYGDLVQVDWDLSEDEVFDGHWHHYRITYDNDYFTCYVDHIKRPAYIGVHNNSNTESTDGYTIKDKSGEMNTQGYDNRIGRSNDTSYRNPFYGQMRNIHFYDHVSEGSITFDVTSSNQTSKMIMDNANAPNYLNTQGPNRIEIDNTSGIGVQMHLTSHDAIVGMGVGSINYISEGDHHVFETENSFMDINKQRLYLPGPVNYNDLSLNNNYKYSEDFINNETGLNVNGSIYVDGPWTDGNPPSVTDLSNRVFGAVDATTGYAKNNLIDGKISNTYTCFDGTQSLYNHSVAGGYKDYAIVDLMETKLTNKNYTTFMHLDGEATYLWNGGTDNFVAVNQTYTIQNQYLNATEVIPTEAYMGGTHLNSNTGGTGYMVTHITKVKINDYLFGILDPVDSNPTRWKMVRIEFAIENNNVIINSISAKNRHNVTAPVTDASNIDYWNNRTHNKTDATSFTSGDLGIYDLEFQIKNYTSEPYFTHGIDQELYFDGTESSVVDLTQEGLTCVKGSNPRTIEFDFKTTSNNAGLISTGYGQTTATHITGASFNIKLISGALFFMGFNKDYTSPNATGLNDDDWHTVKVTYSKPYLSFFVDNVLTDRVASGGTYDGTLITQDDNNVLGRSNDMYDAYSGLSEASYYTGYLRNVRFYDYAQNDNDYNIIYSYVPNFKQNDSYATYSYYKTHGKDCSQYSLFNSDLSLGVGTSPTGASGSWNNFIVQNVLMLGEPNSSNNDSNQFVSLPKEETDVLKSKDGFSIMVYAEVVKGNDYTGDDATILFDLGSTFGYGFGIRVLYWTDGNYYVNIKDSTGNVSNATSGAMSAPSGINCFVLAIKNDSAKFYLNGALLVTNIPNIANILNIPNGYWSIGSCVTATDYSWPMKIYNVATFGKELNKNEINTIKCFSDNNTLSPLINTNKCAYGNTTIDVNRTITNAIVERDVQYIYNHNIKKISICPEHDATPSMLRATRIVTNSKPANGSVDVNHLELQGDGILGGSSIHLNAAQKVIIDGSLNISGNVYYDVSGGIKTIIPDYLQHNSDINAPGFQIFANNEDSGLKIDASGSNAQNPLIMGTTPGSAVDRNIAFSKNAGLHIQPDGQAGVINKNQRGTIDTHRGLDVSGTVFGIYPIGSIMMYPFQVDNIIDNNISNNLPPGWELCDGSALSRTNYSELFSIIGTTYGNGNNSTFKLPNFNTHYYAFGTTNKTQETAFYTTTYGNNSMTTDQLADNPHSHGVTATSGNLSFNNADINTQNKITYVTSADDAMANNHKLPIFKDAQSINDTRSRNMDWSENSGSRITKFSHIYNIITPAGTSVANQNTLSNLMNASETITTNDNMHLPFHASKDNVLDISNQDVTVTHSLTSNNTGIGEPWLPKSTQMKSIIYTGVL